MIIRIAVSWCILYRCVAACAADDISVERRSAARVGQSL